MKSAVISDSESVTLVVEIRTADESTPLVGNGNMCLGAREASQEQQHPQPRLHRGFCSRLCKFEDTPKAGDAWSPDVGFCPRAQQGNAHAPSMESGVSDNHRLCETQPAGQVGKCPC